RNPEQQVTKRFVQQITEQEEPDDILSIINDKYSSGMVLKLTFIGGTAADPVMTELIEKFQLTVTILHGTISQTREGPYGTLFVHVDGKKTSIDEAINFLQTDLQVRLEVVATYD